MTAQSHDTPPRPTALPVHVSGIPHELRQRNQWIIWRYTWKPDKQKWDKPPRTAQHGIVIDPTNDKRWAPFATANTAMSTRHMDGLGYCVGPDDPYTFIDLDHCRDPETGLIDPAAVAVVENLGGYWEISPSGTGLRGVVRATLAGPGRNRPASWRNGEAGRIELYSTGKYLTMTGHVVRDVEIIPEAQAAVDKLYASLEPERTNGQAHEPVGGQAPSAASWEASPPLSDDDVLAKAGAAKNAAAFLRLWGGDARDYPGDDGQVDDSRADAGLLERLAFYTQDRDQLDRLLRRSGLYRAKWERADYRARTLDYVLSRLRETWQPGGDGLMLVLPSRNGEAAPRPCTDLGNSERLLDQHGSDLLYCAALPDGWLTWVDGCWRSDATRGVYKRAKTTVRAIYAEADAATHMSARKELAQWAVRSEAAGKIEAMVNLARSAVAVETQTFDTHSWLLNVQNGVIDLQTGQLRPHRRDLWLTKQTPVAYDADAQCPRWERFILEIFGGDTDLAAFIQRAVGYSLTSDTRERVLFVMHGRGRNGKDTLLEVISTLLGDYALRTPADTLLTRENDRGRVSDDVAALRGGRFVAASETDEGRWLSEAKVKELTGSQTLTARHLYGRYFQFEAEFKLWLATNHQPVIRGTDDGIWDRIRLLPFNVRFYLPWEERPPDAPAADLGLKATLRRELPGILNWAIAGCRAWQREGLGMPAAVQRANTAYRAEMDTLAPFLAECCVQHPSFSVSVGALYQTYVAWCERSGEKPLGKIKFGRQLAERGYRQERGTGGEHHWFGLGLPA
jgi:putative DNA primase/helicase